MLRLHEPPLRIFVLGHQKAGTSAIAALLGAYAGLEVTIDLRREIRDQLALQVYSDELPIGRLIARNRADFSKPVVKHPNLTFLFPQLRDRFPDSRFVFVVRDPRENIRSIFDRLGLSGTGTALHPDQWARLPGPWRLILSGKGLPITSSDHLEVLAERWRLMANIYFANRHQIELVRYEDFTAAKERTIDLLARILGLQQTRKIGDLVDRPYQPQGANRGVDPITFFGEENLARIEATCALAMEKFGYLRSQRS